MLSANFLQSLMEAAIITLVRKVVWVISGKPIPAPNCIKRDLLVKFKKKYSPAVFVETGTLYGNTVFALKHHFDKLYTIELHEQLYLNAKDRFSKIHKIEVIQGDSALRLPDVLARINKRTMFWLDAHYSGMSTGRGSIDTPIGKELHLIADHGVKNHIICIDDARLFNGENDYPQIDDCAKIITEKFPHHSFIIERDIICILPEN